MIVIPHIATQAAIADQGLRLDKCRNCRDERTDILLVLFVAKLPVVRQFASISDA